MLLNEKHDSPLLLTPRYVASILNNPETLLTDIGSGLSYLQCIGLIDPSIRFVYILIVHA